MLGLLRESGPGRPTDSTVSQTPTQCTSASLPAGVVKRRAHLVGELLARHDAGGALGVAGDLRRGRLRGAP